MGQIWAKFCHLTMGRGVGCGAKEIFWQLLKSYVHASIPVNIRFSRVICSFLKATKYQALVQSGGAAEEVLTWINSDSQTVEYQ